MPNRDILGVLVLAATRSEAVSAIDLKLAEPIATLVTFLNAHVSNLAGSNPQLTAILRKSIVLNDGIGVSLASRILHGTDFPENLQGTDFTPQLLRETRHRFRIFCIGSAPGVAQRAVDELRKQAPAHDYVGTADGFFHCQESQSLTAMVAASGANLVLVGMGSPRQELWADKYLIRGLGISAICVGGLLDFMSGEKPRAPDWVQQLRCEWLYRLLVEPSRLWRRYLLGNPLFMARLARAFFVARRA